MPNATYDFDISPVVRSLSVFTYADPAENAVTRNVLVRGEGKTEKLIVSRKVIAKDLGKGGPSRPTTGQIWPR